MAGGHEIAMGLRAAYRSMHRRTEAHLARHGMTADQFVLLSLLAEEDRVNQQSLVQRACSDPNTIRAMLVLLEKRGLVERQRHPADARARCVILTRRGRRIHQELWEEMRCLQDRLSGLLTTEEANLLLDQLQRISAVMTDWDEANDAGSRFQQAEGPMKASHGSVP